ncbi:MAG: fumarate hydratase C-terminal domain-containing protein [Lachnospiraceae bacterium]|nr:fumarate hydratase C-terminal domain-containing protein [Lachnospiraceae bacterium]
MNTLTTLIDAEEILSLKIGEMIYVSGDIFCGRDMVLPKIVKMSENGECEKNGITLSGGVIFHTAVSVAGIGPTSSNKAEIESSIVPLSKAGVRIHIGKGRLMDSTIKGINQYGSVYAIVPPVTALLDKTVKSKKVVCFPELGMEAFHQLTVDNMPIIIAAANGRSIYE